MKNIIQKKNNKDYEYSIEELKELSYDPKMVESFDSYMITNFEVKSRNYYTYLNLFLDSNHNRRYFYSGKGIGERILNAYLVSYACLKLKVLATTKRIKFIMKLFEDKKEVHLIKTKIWVIVRL